MGRCHEVVHSLGELYSNETSYPKHARYTVKLCDKILPLVLYYNHLFFFVTVPRNLLSLFILQMSFGLEMPYLYNYNINDSLSLHLCVFVEVATVVLNRCITDNKSKDCTEKDEDYTVTYNYEFLEDYQEEDELIAALWDDDDDEYDSLDTRRRRDDDEAEYVIVVVITQ